jgi:predicted anti-sigma-YlaC factor YlaD
VDVTDSSLSVDQTVIEKLMRRALALDEGWDQGALHEFLGSWEAGHASAGGSLAKARVHFERAKQCSRAPRASVLVAMAESLAVPSQDRKDFERCLGEALKVEVAKDPSRKLANLIAQRRARWLLSRVDDLFLEAPVMEGKGL